MSDPPIKGEIGMAITTRTFIFATLIGLTCEPSLADTTNPCAGNGGYTNPTKPVTTQCAGEWSNTPTNTEDDIQIANLFFPGLNICIRKCTWYYNLKPAVNAQVPIEECPKDKDQIPAQPHPCLQADGGMLTGAIGRIAFVASKEECTKLFDDSKLTCDYVELDLGGAVLSRSPNYKDFQVTHTGLFEKQMACCGFPQPNY